MQGEITLKIEDKNQLECDSQPETDEDHFWTTSRSYSLVE